MPRRFGAYRLRALPCRRLRAYSAAFTPAALPGLAAFFDADLGLAQLSDGTTPATAAGDRVGYWADQSGNGNHVVQATAGARFTLRVEGGKVCPESDGVDDELTNSAYSQPSGLGAFTFFACVRAVSAVTFGGIITAEPNTCSLSNWVAPDVRAFAAAALGVTATDPTDRGTSAWLAYVAVYDGAAISLRLDGTEVHSDSTTGDTAALSMIRLGNRDSNWGNWRYRAAGLVERALDAGELADLESWLEAKKP
jgi:hypothetical protein